MKVLLISDETLNVNKGGFSQTLYNVFLFLNPNNFLLVTSVQAHQNQSSSAPFTFRTVLYNIHLIPFQHNRLGKHINKLITWVNYSVNYSFKSFKKIQYQIKNFNADVVIVAPNGPQGLFIYHLLKPSFFSKKIIPYFMDDWLDKCKLKWFGNNIQAIAKKILKENGAWLMISKNLADILAQRYKIKPEKVFVVHNPVDTKNFIKPKSIIKKDKYIISYAGALWPMHFDALIVIANAIKILQIQRNVQLVVYTPEEYWNWRKNEMKELNVVYGGHIPYVQIHKKLAEGDYCLLTSSFSKEWITHSKGSVQTKITDYLKSGRLIISCGPTYAANNDFLKQYKCGVCIETNEKAQAATTLNNILNNIEVNEHYIQNGYNVLREEFSFEIVHQRLQKFLAF